MLQHTSRSESGCCRCLANWIQRSSRTSGQSQRPRSDQVTSCLSYAVLSVLASAKRQQFDPTAAVTAPARCGSFEGVFDELFVKRWSASSAQSEGGGPGLPCWVKASSGMYKGSTDSTGMYGSFPPGTGHPRTWRCLLRSVGHECPAHHAVCIWRPCCRHSKSNPCSSASLGHDRRSQHSAGSMGVRPGMVSSELPVALYCPAILRVHAVGHVRDLVTISELYHINSAASSNSTVCISVEGPGDQDPGPSIEAMREGSALPCPAKTWKQRPLMV